MLLREFELAKSVASNTVEMLQKEYFSNAGIISNEGKDIKTKADQAAHEIIVDKLFDTGIPIISEEGKHNSFDINKLQWIIDPLDGTLNFTRGFEMSAISIALWDRGQPVFGVVRHLFCDDIFSSYHLQGAYKSEQRISVANRNKKSQSVLSTGFPSGRNFEDESLAEFLLHIQTYKKIRMLGSAALMLAYVACGYFDVYQENDIYIWDVAAGLSLVSEARGTFSITPGSALFKYNVKASNKFLINKI